MVVMKKLPTEKLAVIAGLLCVGALLIVPMIAAHADTASVTVVNPPEVSGPIQNVSGIVAIFQTALKFVATVFWIISVIFVFYAGYLFATYGANPKRVEDAKNQLLYAAIAIAVGLMAYGLPLFVKNILSGTS